MIAKARVLASWRETGSTHAIRLERPAGFGFAPVQFVGLEIETDEGGVEYPISIASSPTRDHIEFGARVSESAFKRAFVGLAPGDTVEIDGPYGHFVLDESRPAVFLAGGIGVTPLRGMVQYAVDTGLGLPMTLVYSNRAADDVPFGTELDLLAREHAGLDVVHTMTRPKNDWTGRRGRIDRALVEEASRGKDDPTYYVCGTPSMVAGMVEILRGMGVAKERVLYEKFHGYG